MANLERGRRDVRLERIWKCEEPRHAQLGGAPVMMDRASRGRLLLRFWQRGFSVRGYWMLPQRVHHDDVSPCRARVSDNSVK